MRKIFGEIKLHKFLLLTIAGLINAFGVTMFLSPVNLYDSGISGTSMLLSQITPPELSLSVFLLILNVVPVIKLFKNPSVSDIICPSTNKATSQNIDVFVFSRNVTSKLRERNSFFCTSEFNTSLGQVPHNPT